MRGQLRKASKSVLVALAVAGETREIAAQFMVGDQQHLCK